MAGKYKAFLKDAYNDKYLSMCSEWKELLRENFPELFEEEFKEGDWFFDKSFWSDGSNTHVFRVIKNDGNYLYPDLNCFSPNVENVWRNANRCKDVVRKATPEEVEKHLIKEANKRGIINGSIIQTIHPDGKKTGDNAKVEYPLRYNKRIDCLSDNKSWRIYEKGQWAEIIPQEIEQNGLKYVLKDQ